MKNTDKRIYWVWLSLIFGPASKKAVKLVRYFKTASLVYKANAEELLRSGAVSEKDRAFTEILMHDLREAESIVKWCDSKGVSVIVPGSKNYPVSYLSLRDAPMVLYALGTLPEFEKKCCIAVVGTRKMTAYGRTQAFKMGYGLASGGAVVISGLALGIDSVAMAGCMEAGGMTVGILGCGIDNVYPKEHLKLFKSVIKNGAIVTEYPPGRMPERKSFPQRNRLISGMALGTVVVEADAFSGALITARHSIYQGKDVFSLPGNVENENSEGTNQLIKEGAFTVTSPEDVLERYEYIYPHTVNTLTAKRSVKYTDCEALSVEACRKYDVRCTADRYSVYASSLQSNHVDSIKPPVKKQNTPKIPKLETIDNITSRDPETAFGESVKEPVRIDFEMLSDIDKRVYNAMSPDVPMIPDEIKVEGLKIQDVLSSLTMLEISGAVEGGAGGYFMRNSSDDMTFDEINDKEPK